MYHTQINHDYDKRKNVIRKDVIEWVENQTDTTRLFAEFVIAYTLDPDINMTLEILQDYVEHSVELYTEGEIPLDIYLNFVVFPRVSKEKLDVCRRFFFNEVKDLIDKDDVVKTVFNINYWCAAHVRYQLTDPRTKSAKFTYESGSGRCGEKSTFLTHVFRSIGIPSRLIYVPWWTHSDDNHAWIEVYINNEWHFIGPGEGEELLDKAWFGLAASRASFVCSNSVGNIHPEYKLINSKGAWKTLNLTQRYGKVREIEITNQIPNLKKAELSIMNYGRFRPLMSLDFSETETLTVNFGSGEVFVKAQIDDKFLLKKIGTDQNSITLELTDIHDSLVSFSQTPGIVSDIKTFSETDEMIKLKYEKRAVAQKEYTQKINDINTHGMNHSEYKKIEEALGKTVSDKIIAILSPKDLQDFDSAILIEHYETHKHLESEFPEDIFYNYLVNPRVFWENLVPYAEKFKSLFAHIESAHEIFTLIQNTIKDDSLYSVPSCFTPVDRIFEYGLGTSIDKKVLIVAIARSLGIPARYDQFKDDIEYYKDGEFKSFQSQSKRHTLTLNGDLLDFDTSINSLPERTAMSFNTIKKDQIINKQFTSDFNEGLYEVINSKRLPSGKLIGNIQFLNLNKDTQLEVAIDAVNTADIIENVQISDLMDPSFENKGILVIGDAIEEPTAHVLNEIITQKEMFNELNIPVYFYALNGSENLELVKKVNQSISKLHIKQLMHKDTENTLIRRVFREPGVYPFTLVFKDGQSIISNSGYNVGTIDNTWLLSVLEEA